MYSTASKNSCRFLFAGTRVEDAKAIFTTSDLRILAVDNLEEAAKMVSDVNPPPPPPPPSSKQ